DTSGCGGGRCGDHIVNGPEFCDGAPPAVQSCLDYGFDLGALGCKAVCTPDFAACRTIGWKPVFSGVSTILFAVWGSGRSDVFVAGYGGTILHYDGSRWLPLSSGTTAELSGVWGSGPRDVFAVGEMGTILHFDGAAWRPMTSGTMAFLSGIW